MATKNQDLKEHKAKKVAEKRAEESSLCSHNINPWIQKIEAYGAGKTFEEVIKAYGFEEKQILRLASNETTIGTSPKAIEAAITAAFRSNYYDEPKSESLVHALERKFENDGVDMSKVGVVVGNGLDNIMEHLARLFLSKDSSVITCPPTFVYYNLVAKWVGSEVINVPRNIKDNFNLNIDEILSTVKDDTRILFLCSPNNPTGHIIPIEQIETLAKNLLERDVLLFVDHAYIEFTDPAYDAKHLIAKYPNIITGYTFSKAYAMAGFRVGYALMSKGLQQEYMKVITPFACARASIAAAKAALEDTEHLKKVVDINNKGKEYLYKELDRLGFEYHKTEANFIIMRNLKDTADEILDKLLKQAIIVRAAKTVCPYCIRVTIGTDAENQRLVEALEKL